MATLEELTREVAALRARVEANEAVHAIHDLKARYAQLVDARYSRGKPLEGERLAEIARDIAALFTHDGVWEGGKALGTATGRDEIAERMRAPTLLFSWHYFLKPSIQVEGARARARWDLLSPCTTKDGRPHWMCGYEDDEYERVGGVWLHRRMKLTVVFLSPHETGWQKVLV